MTRMHFGLDIGRIEMTHVKNIELLPKFLEDVRQQFGSERLSDSKFMSAAVMDLLPGAAELSRCLRMVYTSGAMEELLAIGGKVSECDRYRTLAVEKLVNYWFMDQRIAWEIVDHILAAICPEAEKGSIPADFRSEPRMDNREELNENREDFQVIQWYQTAAQHGDAASQNDLGDFYRDGLGVEQDDTKAVYWYQKAAENGYAAAQNSLANCYRDGRGTGQDYAQAVYWYQKAADLGNAAAQNNLGNCYFNGWGVPQSRVQASRWYQKSALNGNAAARVNLRKC